MSSPPRRAASLRRATLQGGTSAPATSATSGTRVSRHLGAVVGNRFRIDSLLARGSSSNVSRAVDLTTGETVALKVVAMDNDRNARRRFLREVGAMARLEHPGLVRVLAYGATLEGDAYLAMELAPGKTLRARMAGRKGIAPRDGVRILTPIAAALDAIHDARLVHRDVCPENIVVDDDGEARLVDFGAAYSWHDQGERLTADGALVSSPIYMPPEVAAGLVPSRAWDVYSLAVILFEIIAGAPPFSGYGLEVIEAKMQRPAPALATVRGSLVTLPVELALARALDRKPGARPRTASDLVTEVRAALDAGH